MSSPNEAGKTHVTAFTRTAPSSKIKERLNAYLSQKCIKEPTLDQRLAVEQSPAWKGFKESSDVDAQMIQSSDPVLHETEAKRLTATQKEPKESADVDHSMDGFPGPAGDESEARVLSATQKEAKASGEVDLEGGQSHGSTLEESEAKLLLADQHGTKDRLSECLSQNGIKEPTIDQKPVKRLSAALRESTPQLAQNPSPTLDRPEANVLSATQKGTKTSRKVDLEVDQSPGPTLLEDAKAKVLSATHHGIKDRLAACLLQKGIKEPTVDQRPATRQSAAPNGINSMVPQNPCPPLDNTDARDVSATQQGIKETSAVDLELNQAPSPPQEDTEAKVLAATQHGIKDRLTNCLSQKGAKELAMDQGPVPRLFAAPRGINPKLAQNPTPTVGKTERGDLTVVERVFF